ncbi:hypothetical protein M9435_006067 [Picochlorum sp. BPE23]|nr:hypothetical protein M9435_006067 [Picochlorum sp. BPE23]
MTRRVAKLSTVSLSQGNGVSRRGSARHRHRHAIQKTGAIGKPAIRRLARRAGVKRISQGIYEEAPEALKRWLRTMVHDATVYADHAKRFTITTNDILLALKKNGVTLYGYAFTEKRERLTKKMTASSLQAAAAKVKARRASTTPAKGAAERRVESVATPAQEQQQQEQEEENASTQLTPANIVEDRRVSVGKKKATPQSGRRNALAPKTPQDVAQNDGGVTSVSPERAQDIQTSLSSFRDTVIARQASSDAPVPKVVDWVSAHLLGRGKEACSMAEMDIVLEALSDRDALMVTHDDEHSFKTVWFI